LFVAKERPVPGGPRVLACSLLLLVALSGCAEEAGTSAPASRSEAPSEEPSAPASEPSSDPLDPPSPADVVDDPGARLLDVAVSPEDPQVRAAVWSTCPAPDCSARHVAVAVTTDDSTSRVVADRVWRAVPVVSVDGQGNVLVASWQQRFAMALVRPDGSVVDVRRSRTESPVEAGEVVAGTSFGRRGATTYFATDPVSATAHAVPVPRDTQRLARVGTGQLRAITRHGTYAWSDDGGATWTESAGASDTLLQSFVTSAPDLHVLVGGGDGATLFPFGEIRWIHEPDGWSVTAVPDRPRAYIGATAVLPDGRFLADVEAWSDAGSPSRRRPGLHVSDGGDWASYTRLELGEPFAATHRGAPDVRHVDVTGARTSIGAIGPDGRSWWTSADLGATWTEQRAR
jgi:hypothetical protein